MKTTKPLQLLSLLAACALLLHGPAAFAQPLPPPADPNVQVEANDNGDETMTNAAPAIEEEDKTPGLRHEAIVEFGKDVVLKASDSAEVIVVIGGSAKILGKCDDVIVIGGELDVEGKVRSSAIVVLGTLRAFKNAVLNGDVVAVGGGLEIEEGATVSRRPVEIGFHGLKMEWLKKWLVHCVLKMRPLAPQVGWVWGFAGVFFLVYLLIAAAFPRPVQACVDELTRRPATTFLAGVLMKLLFPILTIVLIMTGVGVLVVPFLVAAWIIGFIVGKVAILEFFGGKIGQSFGAGTKPIAAFIIGSILITLLYLVPFIGLITFAVISLWGLGASATALLSRFRRERPAKPAPTLPGNGTNPPPSASIPSAAGIENMAQESIPSAPPIATPGVAQTQLPTALAFPRASFWERMGAGILDLIIVGILGGLVGGPPQGFLVALTYFAGMWAWKGTTIGGIVLKLQVVRVDGGPLTILVAIVRGLAAGFSALVLFLGFFWIGWDRDKQAWHDKIVGTVVLRMPYSTALVCL